MSLEHGDFVVIFIQAVAKEDFKVQSSKMRA